VQQVRVQLPGGAGFRLTGWRAGAASALAALTVVVLLLTLLGKLPGQGATATASTPTTGSASQTPSASLSIGPDVAGQVLAPVGDAAREPTRAGLAAALAALIGDKHLGMHVGGAVVDIGTGRLLYGHDANGSFAPASTSKLLTATAALATLGPDFRIATKVVAGAVRGQIVLVGGGDPTLSTSAPVGFVPAPASLSELARSTAAALRAAGTTTVSLAYDDTLFSGPRTAPTWPATYVSTGVVAPITALTLDEGRVGAIVEGTAPRVPDPPVAAARAFARRLAALGIKVTGTPTAVKAPPAPATSPTSPTSPTPSSGSSGSSGSSSSTGSSTGTSTGSPSPVPLVAGTTLGLVRSPALSDLVGWMLAASDNDLAEAVAHLTALAAGEDPSFEGGVAAVTKTLTALGIQVQGIHVYDASGLTGSTQVPPAVLAQVLALAGSPAHPQLRSLLTGLAVAGFTGSLGTRFEDPTTWRAAGLVRAKTGTLSVVSAIAGTVDDADGRVLAFVFLADEVTPGGTLAARLALDRLVTAVAGCGCR
jgi:D-alanyl-D-alanine carboxypeptidase/D-alanyl-D-alanine-endopeptidase (penicillin-binding protein 4)